MGVRKVSFFPFGSLRLNVWLKKIFWQSQLLSKLSGCVGKLDFIDLYAENMELRPGIFSLINLLNLSGPYASIVFLVSGVVLKCLSSRSAQWSSRLSTRYLLIQLHFMALVK